MIVVKINRRSFLSVSALSDINNLEIADLLYIFLEEKIVDWRVSCFLRERAGSGREHIR